MEKLAERLYYIPASDDPLSADVGVFYGDNRIWLFDVGYGEKVLSQIREACNMPAGKGKKISIVISHFHPDHMGNINAFNDADIYVGANTRKYLDKGIVVDKDMYIDDGVKLHIFPFPSSHAKGSLGFEIEESYVWLGDGAYTTVINGMSCYNAGVLLEGIKVLKALAAENVLLSHQKRIVRDKAAVVSWLEKIYNSRKANEPYIKA